MSKVNLLISKASTDELLSCLSVPSSVDIPIAAAIARAPPTAPVLIHVGTVVSSPLCYLVVKYRFTKTLL